MQVTGTPNTARYDREVNHPWPFIEAFRESGIFGVWFPKQYGGEEAEQRSIVDPRSMHLECSRWAY